MMGPHSRTAELNVLNVRVLLGDQGPLLVPDTAVLNILYICPHMQEQKIEKASQDDSP